MKTKLWATATRALAFAALCGAASLSQAQMYSPSGCEQVSSATVTFSWPVTGGVSHYTVLVDTNNPPSLSTPEDSFFTFGESSTMFTSSYTYPLDGQNRYWVVYPDSDVAQASPVQCFVSGSGGAPGVPNLTSPQDGYCIEDNSFIVLGWDTVAEAQWYNIQVLKGGNVIYELNGLNRNNLVIHQSSMSGAVAGDDLQWQVQACHGGGCSDWATRNFCINEGQPEITASPASLDFGIQSPIYSANMDVQNIGTGDLNVTNITSSAAWLTVGLTSFSVGAGGSQAVGLELDGAASGAGTFNETLTIASNASNDMNYAVAVTFTSPGASGLPTTDSGTIDLISSGTADLTINSITLGANSDWVTSMNASPPAAVTLPPNDRTTVTVNVDGSGYAVGVYCTTLEVASDAVNAAALSVVMCLNVTEASSGGMTCFHPTDSNVDGSISNTEYTAAYQQWQNGQITTSVFLFAYNANAGGGAYCCDAGNYTVGACA